MNFSSDPESPYHNTLAAHYKAVRARLDRGPPLALPKPPAPPVEAPTPAIEPADTKPTINIFDGVIPLVQPGYCGPQWVARATPSRGVKRIAREVCDAHGVEVEDVERSCRKPELVQARHKIFYRLKTETPLSFLQIGRIFGGRDHTSVRHGVTRHALRNGLPVPPGLEYGAAAIRARDMLKLGSVGT